MIDQTSSAPIGGATVDAYVYLPTGGARGLLRQAADGTTASTPSGSDTSLADGSYTLNGLGAATYEIKINPPSGTGHTSITIRITIPAGVSISIEVRLTKSTDADDIGDITIDPANAVVALNGTQQYTATVKGKDGSAKTLKPFWFVDPPDLGKIAPSGLFTAGGKDGRGQIVAQVADRRKSVPVTVGQPTGAANTAPTLGDLQVQPATTVRPGTRCLITAPATDPDPGDRLFFKWTATGGKIFPSFRPEVAEWTAPDTEGSYTVTCHVTDLAGAAAPDKSINLTVSKAAPGNPPIIAGLFASPPRTGPGGDIFVRCEAKDPDPGDQAGLRYNWSAAAGTIVPDPANPANAKWTAKGTDGSPLANGDYEVSCQVTDPGGLSSDKKTIKVTVGGSGFTVTVKGRGQ